MERQMVFPEFNQNHSVTPVISSVQPSVNRQYVEFWSKRLEALPTDAQARIIRKVEVALIDEETKL